MVTKPHLKILQNRNPGYFFLQRSHVLDDRFLGATSDQKVVLMICWLFTWRGQEAIIKYQDNVVETPEGIIYSDLVWLPVELLREFNVDDPKAAVDGLVKKKILEPVETDIYRLNWYSAKASRKTINQHLSSKTRTKNTTKKRTPRPGFNGKRSYEIEEAE